MKEPENQVGKTNEFSVSGETALDIHGELAECLTEEDLVELLQTDADDGECEAMKELKRAISKGTMVGSLSWASVISALCDILESDASVHLKLESASALQKATGRMSVTHQQFWEVLDIVSNTQHPAVVEKLIPIVVELVCSGPAASVRSVVDVLAALLEENYTTGSSVGLDKAAAAKGLKRLAEHGHGVVLQAEPATMASEAGNPTADLVAAAFAASDTVISAGADRRELTQAQTQQREARALLANLGEECQEDVLAYLDRVETK